MSPSWIRSFDINLEQLRSIGGFGTDKICVNWTWNRICKTVFIKKTKMDILFSCNLFFNGYGLRCSVDSEQNEIQINYSYWTRYFDTDGKDYLYWPTFFSLSPVYCILMEFHL